MKKEDRRVIFAAFILGIVAMLIIYNLSPLEIMVENLLAVLH